MRKTERWERRQKAIEEGEQAYRANVPLEDCPYKSSEFSLGHWWMMGWHDAENEALEGVDDV